MVKNIVIAPLGDNIEALFVGIKEFPTEKVILMVPEDKVKEVDEIRKDLSRFRIPLEILKIKGNLWEGMFKAIGEIKNKVSENILVNVATGDRNTQCAATSASFVNGVKAFSVENGEAMMLPVLKFNYYTLLTDKKISILKLLEDNSCCGSLDELAKKTNMSLPLISYHINGSRKAEGLKEMGLVETKEIGGKIEVKLSMLGQLLIKGYVESSKT